MLRAYKLDEEINQMEWTTRGTSNRHRTRRERERGEERRKKRGALKATVCLGFLSPCRDRQVHHHTRPPRNSQTHRRHRNSRGRKNPVRNPALHIPPAPKRSPEPVPNPANPCWNSPILRGSPPPPPPCDRPASPSQPQPRISTRGVSPLSLSATAATNCRDRPVIGDLLGPSRPGAPFRGNPLWSRGGAPSFSPPPRSAGTWVAWGVEIHPGVDRFLSIRWWVTLACSGGLLKDFVLFSWTWGFVSDVIPC